MIKFLIKRSYFILRYNYDSFLSQASLLPFCTIPLLFPVCEYLLIAVCEENENIPSIPLICVFQCFYFDKNLQP